MPRNIFIHSKRLFRSLSALTLLSLLLVLSLVTRPMSAAPQVVFTNNTPITINTNPQPPTLASPYPSSIAVSGMTGTTTKVTVTLNNLSHTRVSDLDMLLVSPTGQKFVMFSDISQSIQTAANNVTVTLDDAAPNLMPFSAALTSGNYRATAYFESETNFPAPAPTGPYSHAQTSGGSTFTIFNANDPNGTWNLYVMDDTIAQSGSIAGGWSISVTTTGTAATAFSNTSSININDAPSTSATATPYPSSIAVTGQTGVVTDVNVTLNGFSHTRTSDVAVLLTNPNGVGVVLMSFAGGSNVSNNLTLTFDDAASGFLQTPLMSGTYRPSPSGIPPFPSPAPNSTGYFTQLSSLNGFSPNGNWNLYVVDTLSGETGSISGGWSLDLTIAPYTPPVIGCTIPSFGQTSSLPVGSSPTGIARGNFNNDANQDLVVVNQGANNVSVLLGNGMGGFGSAINYGTGTSPYSVAVGNFNGDMNQDLVVVNSGANSVSVLLGDGMGGFSAPTNFQVGLSPISVAVADFNNDMNQDLAVANFGGFFAGTVSILLGTGTGTFGPATNFGVRTQPSFVAVGNFNADSNLDLAVSNFGSDNVSILSGTGTGAFTTEPNVNVGTGPVSIAVADYNSDGKDDLAVANYNADFVVLRLGTGLGTFSTGQNIIAGTNPIAVVTADFNGDLKPDLAIANSGSNNVRMLLNDGNGNFGFGLGVNTFAVGTGPNAIAFGDFNGDGRNDFATANSSANNVSVLVNTCTVAKGNRIDFDSDRRTDFTIFRPGNGVWYVLRSSSGFTNFSGLTLGTSTDKIVPEDYNGDGTTDFAYFRPSTGRWVVPGVYDIEFGISTDIPVPADYDGDGRADLAVYRPSEGAWYIRRSIDNNWMSFLFGTAEDKPVPRDYDGDGKADIAIFRPSAAGWYILRSSDNQVTGVQFGISTDRPVPADYDGDGKADVAVYRPADSAWYIQKSSDSMVLSYAWGASGDIPLQGDFDGDAKFDVAVWRPSTAAWYVLRSTDGALLSQIWGVSTDIPVPSVYIPQ
jgi:subtilisin-like proprotein convertase family protein